MATAQYGPTPDATMRSMLEAGVHFGHQAKRWNPKMKPYIHSNRNGIHIIDLDQTLGYMEEARNFVRDTTQNGGRILFVGTKKQAQDVVASEAIRSGQFYVNRRWLGGTLTNFVTIRQRLRTLKELQKAAENDEFVNLPKKEAAAKMTEMERLERTLGGMRDMTTLPAGIFIIDPKREHLAIAEAQRLGIPVIALTDTNADPDKIDMIVPGNDDAIRSVRLISSWIADAAIEGSTIADIEIEQAEYEAEKEEGLGEPSEAEAISNADAQ